jgi:hypothetical protein
LVHPKTGIFHPSKKERKKGKLRREIISGTLESDGRRLRKLEGECSDYDQS